MQEANTAYDRMKEAQELEMQPNLAEQTRALADRKRQRPKSPAQVTASRHDASNASSRSVALTPDHRATLRRSELPDEWHYASTPAGRAAASRRTDVTNDMITEHWNQDENGIQRNSERPTSDIRIARPEVAAEYRWGIEYRPTWEERPRTIAQWHQQSDWHYSQWNRQDSGDNHQWRQ